MENFWGQKFPSSRSMCKLCLNCALLTCIIWWSWIKFLLSLVLTRSERVGIGLRSVLYKSRSSNRDFLPVSCRPNFLWKQRTTFENICSVEYTGPWSIGSLFSFSSKSPIMSPSKVGRPSFTSGEIGALLSTTSVPNASSWTQSP